MHPVCAGQIKAARALLGWSQEDLASATGLAINTIRKIEMGLISPRITTNNAIRRVIEEAGIEFTEGEGVKRRNDAVVIYQGPGSCEAFWDDVAQTVRKKDGDVLIIVRSQKILMRSCDGLQRLNELAGIASIKCMLAEYPDASSILPAFEFRKASKQTIGPLPTFVYGDKYAMVIADDGSAPRFAVFKLGGIAQSYRSYFSLLWDDSEPLLTSTQRKLKNLVGA